MTLRHGEAAWPLTVAAAMPGEGTSWGHHGELLQGVFDVGDAGPPWHALVTLPCHRFGSRAVYRPADQPLAVTPHWKHKAYRAAGALLRRLGLPLTGALEVSSSAPVSRGLGSSTSDVVASIRSVASAYGLTISPALCAELAVQAERASDPLMFSDSPILFAQRRGWVLENIADRLPEFDLVSLDITSIRGIVQTDEQRLPHYGPEQLADFGGLLRSLRSAVLGGDVKGLAAVATKSAHINAAVYDWDCTQVEAIARESGAFGWQLAHSGSVVGLIFAPGDSAADRAAEIADRAGLTGSWKFRVGAR